MKRKILSMLMVLVLMGVMIGGCGKDETPDKTDVIASVEKEVSTETEETTNEVETTKESTVESTEEPTDEATAQPEETPSVEVTLEPTEEVPPQPQFTFTDLSQTMYAANSVNVRDLPSTDGTKLGGLSTNQEVAVTGQCNETSWYRISYNNGEAFVSDKYLVTEKVVTQPVETAQSGGEVAQQPVEETQETSDYPDFPYNLYEVIFEDSVCYWYTDGNPDGLNVAFKQISETLNRSDVWGWESTTEDMGQYKNKGTYAQGDWMRVTKITRVIP